MGHPIGPQGIERGQSELQRMESEDVRNDLVQLLAFPFEHVVATRRLEPVLQTYNLAVHECESASIALQQRQSKNAPGRCWGGGSAEGDAADFRLYGPASATARFHFSQVNGPTGTVCPYG